MAAPIEVSYHRIDPPAGLDERIHKLIGELDKYENDITSGRVVVEGAHRHGHKTVVEVAVELDLPKAKIVGRRSAEVPSPAGQRSLTQATTEAFRVVQRQLKEHMASLRHDEKTLEHQPVYGRISEIDRASESGFVEMPDGTSLFFSRAVLRNADFEALLEGDMVMATKADEEGTYGPEASSVEPVAPDNKIR